MFYFCSQTIVALNQVGGSEGFGNVPVDTEKLAAEDAAIAVVIGGTNIAAAATYKALITYSAQDNAIYVTFMNGSETVDTIAIVNGKAVLPTTTPTLAANPAYATKAYTFVEWVDDNGNAITDATDISANTTVYAKFKSDLVYGDVTGEGIVDATDRGYVHAYIMSGGKSVPGSVTKSISEYLTDSAIVGGNVTIGDAIVDATDRGYIHAYVMSGGKSVPGNTTKNYYIINK